MTDLQACVVCHRDRLTEHERQTCLTCLGRTRRDLIAVEQLWALLPGEISGWSGSSGSFVPFESHGGDEEPLPGGDALVMLAGGSAHWHYGETGPDSVLGVLERCEADWRKTLEIPAATDEATVTGCVVFLLRGVSHMSQAHPVFHEFAREIRQLRGHLERVLREGEPRDRPEIDCPECGGDLKSVYAKPDPCPPGCAHDGEGHDQGGLRSWWTCGDRRCGHIVTSAEYWVLSRQVKQDRLDRERGDREAM